MIEQIHSDGAGNYHAQSRVFAGETIPDGFGGLLAAWTYSSPGNKEGENPHFAARLTRLDGDDQHDFTLPMPGWTADPASLFETAMVLGDDNVLIATDGHSVLSFDTTQGNLNWIKDAGGWKINIQFAMAGGAVLCLRGQIWGVQLQFHLLRSGTIDPSSRLAFVSPLRHLEGPRLLPHVRADR